MSGVTYDSDHGCGYEQQHDRNHDCEDKCDYELRQSYEAFDYLGRLFIRLFNTKAETIADDIVRLARSRSNIDCTKGAKVLDTVNKYLGIIGGFIAIATALTTTVLYIGGIKDQAAGVEKGLASYSQVMDKKLKDFSSDTDKKLDRKFAELDKRIDDKFASMSASNSNEFAHLNKQADERHAQISKSIERISRSID